MNGKIPHFMNGVPLLFVSPIPLFMNGRPGEKGCSIPLFMNDNPTFMNGAIAVLLLWPALGINSFCVISIMTIL